jgi:hypothetical protein
MSIHYYKIMAKSKKQ